MTHWEEMRKCVEELKRIAREHPVKALLVAQQPEPAYRAPPDTTPRAIIVDYMGLLR